MKRDLLVVTSLSAILIGLTIFIGGCPPIKPPVIIGDASDATAPTDGPLDDDSPPSMTIDASILCATACEHLKSLRCKEGALVDCAEVVCRMNADTHFRHYDLACITSATTIADVRACGGECTP